MVWRPVNLIPVNSRDRIDCESYLLFRRQFNEFDDARRVRHGVIPDVGVAEEGPGYWGGGGGP